MASARVHRWALTLSAYDYEVQYVPGKEHTNTDVFSQLLLPVQPRGVQCLKIELSPVTVEQIKAWTDCDPVLSQVCKFVLEGWPNPTDPEFYPYHSR